LKKIGIFILIFSALTYARYDALPTQTCEAFNNMKHTHNTHHVLLDISKKYTVLRQHKGQKLILVKGESPAQRWVDANCFSKSKKRTNRDDVVPVVSKVISIEDRLSQKGIKTHTQIDTKKYLNKKSSKQNLLTLSWHNAFCETHKYKKECKRSLFSNKKRYSESHFALHGLWPQPRNNLYCNVDKQLVGMDKHKQWRDLPCLALDESTENALEKIMPGYASGLHKHEWIKHGTCYGTDANTYYADAIKLVEQVNISKVGSFFEKNIGKKVTLKQVRYLFDKTFGTGAGKRVEFKCKKGLITELWLHLGSGSNDLKSLLASGKIVRSRCHKGLIDRAGF